MCAAVSQCAGHPGDEHEYFRAITEAVVPKRQPASDVVGEMIQKDAPERDAAASIDAWVAAWPFRLRQRACQWLRSGFRLRTQTAQHLRIAFDFRQRPANVNVQRSPMLVEVDR